MIRWKAPPWTILVLSIILGLVGLTPTQTNANSTKCVSGGLPLEWYATCPSEVESPMIGAQFAATLPQEVRSADATCAVCFGHCVFSSSMATTSQMSEKATMRPALMTSTMSAGSTSAAVLCDYNIFKTTNRLNPAAYTSEGATQRDTGHAPIETAQIIDMRSMSLRLDGSSHSNAFVELNIFRSDGTGKLDERSGWRSTDVALRLDGSDASALAERVGSRSTTHDLALQDIMRTTTLFPAKDARAAPLVIVDIT